jgi:hypothetical protein
MEAFEVYDATKRRDRNSDNPKVINMEFIIESVLIILYIILFFHLWLKYDSMFDKYKD